MADTSFQPDPKIAEDAAAYSQEAVGLADRILGVTLDWSEDSVRQVEQVLGWLHEDMPRTRPSDDVIWAFARAFGSYVGEVARRHHGGEWGTVYMGGESFPGLQKAGGRLCWPWARAYKRITNGPEDNIWHYYQMLVAAQA